MKIAHMALWTTELEAQARFWTDFLMVRAMRNTAARTIPDSSLTLCALGMILRLN